MVSICSLIARSMVLRLTRTKKVAILYHPISLRPRGQVRPEVGFRPADQFLVAKTSSYHAETLSEKVLTCYNEESVFRPMPLTPFETNGSDKKIFLLKP